MEKLVEIMLNEGLDEDTIVNVINNLMNEEVEEETHSLSESCFNDIVSLVEELIYESNYTAGDMVKVAKKSKENMLNLRDQIEATEGKQLPKDHPISKKLTDYDQKEFFWSKIKPDVPAKKVRADAAKAEQKHSQRTDAAIESNNNSISNPHTFNNFRSGDHVLTSRGREAIGQLLRGKSWNNELGNAHIGAGFDAYSRNGNQAAKEILQNQMSKKDENGGFNNPFSKA